MKQDHSLKEIVKDIKSKLISLFVIWVLFIWVSCTPNVRSDSASAPVLFSSEIPVDVDPALQQKLKNENKLYELNEAFNEFSWQAFIAIQWPRDKEGNPMPNYTDEGTSTWLGWKESFQVYRKDGKKPAPWGSRRTASGSIPVDKLQDDDARIVLSSKTPTHPGNLNIADELDQAFAGELFDQNGNVVWYEALMNKEEFDYVVANQLYNINGQIAFSAANDSLADFPKGNYIKKQLGAIEIKIAWKILEDSDIKERYYRNKGYILEEGTLVKKDLGMIGFHISQKTPTGKQWVWSTFEHIDNLKQNVVEKDGKSQIVPPTLTDPNCEICPINVDVTNNSSYTYHEDEHGAYWLVKTQVGNTKDSTSAKYFANGRVMKTQAKRMVEIPMRVNSINKKMQDYFSNQNSVWQYYELVDTQFPLDQDAPPAPDLASDYVLPQSVINKPGGKPNLALLTNMTMETFFQVGNQPATNLIENNPKIENRTIFGTESCMGCHSSAPITIGYTSPDKLITGEQLSGDFSWLLSKAYWNDSIPPVSQ